MLAKPATGLIIAGKYKLLESIGSGGMSEVYRAENLVLGREVALKLLHPGHAGDESLTARFFQEAQSISRIRHPGIVEVIDAGNGETGPYLVMEYLVGESAARVLSRRQRLSIPEAVATALPVLNALGAAHDLDIVHRDLKPENIFYRADPGQGVTVKLLDFGIAKLLSPLGATPRTSTGVVFGTPDYLSPEQAAGESHVDGRSDLFSVGVVLYELLTGTRPFHAPTTVATAYRITHARTPQLKDNGGPDDATLDAILQRVLAKRPEERHANASELAAELALLVDEKDRVSALSALLQPARTEWTSGVRAKAPEVQETQRAAVSRDAAVQRSKSGAHTPSQFPPRDGTTRRSRYEPSAAEPDSSEDLTTRHSRPPGRIGVSRHVRGVVLRAIDQYVRQAFGDTARERVLDLMGRKRCPDLELGAVQAILPYELDTLSSYLDAVSHEFAGHSPTWARLAGGDAVKGELAPLLKHAISSDGSHTTLRRVVPLLSRFCDFGAWELELGDRAIKLQISGAESMPLGFRWWLVGVLEGTLRESGCAVTVSISRGDTPFAPLLVLDITERY